MTTTNIDAGKTLLAYPKCPKCRNSTGFVACYEERRWTEYPSDGITLDGIIAENEGSPDASDESDFIALTRVTDEKQVIACESCHMLYVPVVADESTVVLESVDDEDTTFEG